jgi:hypothetical protein
MAWLCCDPADEPQALLKLLRQSIAGCPEFIEKNYDDHITIHYTRQDDRLFASHSCSDTTCQLVPRAFSQVQRRDVPAVGERRNALRPLPAAAAPRVPRVRTDTKSPWHVSLLRPVLDLVCGAGW